MQQNLKKKTVVIVTTSVDIILCMHQRLFVRNMDSQSYLCNVTLARCVLKEPNSLQSSDILLVFFSSQKIKDKLIALLFKLLLEYETNETKKLLHYK